MIQKRYLVSYNSDCHLKFSFTFFFGSGKYACITFYFLSISANAIWYHCFMQNDYKVSRPVEKCWSEP
jgi:hypothetical protein